MADGVQGGQIKAADTVALNKQARVEITAFAARRLEYSRTEGRCELGDKETVRDLSTQIKHTGAQGGYR